MSGLTARVGLNLALLLVAGALVVFIWLGPASKPPPEPERLSRIDTSTVGRVRIERRGRPPLVLSREGARWHLVKPFDRPADAARVTALLGLASARVHEAFRAIGNDLAAFGLEPPVARVWFDDEAFAFGDTDPLNGWRYVRYGPDVHLITDAYFHHVLATPPAFLDPAPLAGAGRPVGIRVMSRRPGQAVSATAPADDQALVDAWVGARAKAVRALDPGLDWNEAVTVLPPDGKPEIRFQVARLERELAVARPDWDVQYLFPRAAGEKLLGAKGR